MNEIKTFENAEFGQVRTIEMNGQPYFMASDVAQALGYAKPHNAIQQHCRATLKQGTPISGKIQEVNFIPESDIYRLIIKSKLPSAQRFEKWVMEEVLPSIRKNGGYIAGQENLSDDELLERAVLVARKKIAERDEIIKRQQIQIEADKPKTIFADAVSASKTSILIGDLAKLICQNGFKIGQKRLFDWLRSNGYLIKSGDSKNMPTQRYIEQGLFEIKESNIQNPDGSIRITKTTKVTGKGQIYFVNKFLQEPGAEGI